MTFMDHSGEDGSLVEDESGTWCSSSSVSDDETSNDEAGSHTAACEEGFT